MVTSKNQRYSRAFWTILLVVAIAFVLMRFINIDADPSNKVRPGGLFNDEGRWAVNSLAHAQHGDWYTEGGYNPSILVPVVPTLQATIFDMFGVSFFAVRYLTAVFFVVGIGATYYLVRKIEGHKAGCVAMIFLATNVLCFTFSRIGFLDISMMSLVMCSLGAVCLAPMCGLVGACVISAIFFVLAVLTKSTALMSLPAILLLVLLGDGTTKGKLLGAGAFLVVGLGLPAIYLMVVANRFPDDVAFFHTQNIAFTAKASVEVLIKELFYVTNPVFLIMAGVVFVLAVCRYKQFAKYRLVYVGGAIAGAFLFASLMKGYNPPRYQIPLVFGIALMLAGAVKHMAVNIRSGVGNLVCCVMFFLCVAWPGVKVIRYMAEPTYRFIEMSQDIEKRIQETGTDDPLLLGKSFQSRVAMATGIKCADTRSRFFDTRNRFADTDRTANEEFLRSLVGDRETIFVIHNKVRPWEKLMLWPAGFEVVDAIEYEFRSNYKGWKTERVYFCTLEKK